MEPPGLCPVLGLQLRAEEVERGMAVPSPSTPRAASPKFIRGIRVRFLQTSTPPLPALGTGARDLLPAPFPLRSWGAVPSVTRVLRLQVSEVRPSQDKSAEQNLCFSVQQVLPRPPALPSGDWPSRRLISATRGRGSLPQPSEQGRGGACLGLAAGWLPSPLTDGPAPSPPSPPGPLVSVLYDPFPCRICTLTRGPRCRAWDQHPIGTLG